MNTTATKSLPIPSKGFRIARRPGQAATTGIDWRIFETYTETWIDVAPGAEISAEAGGVYEAPDPTTTIVLDYSI